MGEKVLCTIRLGYLVEMQGDRQLFGSPLDVFFQKGRDVSDNMILQ
jgi:hypothetical protein